MSLERDELKENFVEEQMSPPSSKATQDEQGICLMYQSCYETCYKLKRTRQAEHTELLKAEQESLQQLASRTKREEALRLAVEALNRQVAELEVGSRAVYDRKLQQLEALRSKNRASTEEGTEESAMIVAIESKHSLAQEVTSSLRATLNEAIARRQTKAELLGDLKTIYESYRQYIVGSDSVLLQVQQELKASHNYLQDLQGNIRVFCRVRPMIASDQGAMSVFQLSENSISLIQEGQLHSFNFDRVFGPEASQVEVFDEVSQLVKSAVDGYKVCMFAYGQTGSGKTHTMEGPLGEDIMELDKGIVQRSVEQIFQAFALQSQLGWTYSVEVTCIEVYNEQVRDLLEDSKKLTAFSTNMISPTILKVTEPAQLYPILKLARQQRAAAQTMCNVRSSRSHSLFTLKLTGYHAQSQTETCGALNMIDLAGSERLDRSQVEGDRLEETKSINKSLSCLSLVIQAIARKDKYIPFRNSKLTHLLQGHLGPESKTLMFVNVSPLELNLKESLSSLRFARKVNECHLGCAQRQTRNVSR